MRTHQLLITVCLCFCLGVIGCVDSVMDPPDSVEPVSLGGETVPPSEDFSEKEPETSVMAVEDVKLAQASWEDILTEVSTHKGKIVVLDLWSTSCQPCLREFPHLVNLSQKYPNQVICLSCSIDYVGISSKPPEYYEERVRKFLSSQNAMFDNYLCTDPSDDLTQQIDLGSIPAVYVFSSDGEVAERFDNDDDQKYDGEFTYVDHVIPKITSLLESTE